MHTTVQSDTFVAGGSGAGSCGFDRRIPDGGGGGEVVAEDSNITIHNC